LSIISQFVAFCNTFYKVFYKNWSFFIFLLIFVLSVA